MTLFPSDHPAEWMRSHPFIDFSLNCDRLAPKTWSLLGECSSKIDHILSVPLMPETSDNLRQIYLAKGVHGTTAIEGNTLSEEQVKLRIEGRLKLPASQEYHGAAVDNILRTLNQLIDRVATGDSPPLRPHDLREINRQVLAGLPVEMGVVPGEYRSGRVRVWDYWSPDQRHTEELVERWCEWMASPSWMEAELGARFVGPILKAIVGHLFFAWIHPFGDGNGRTARAVEFYILTRAGAPPISAHLLSDHYNKTRDTYYRALSVARRNREEFIHYAAEGLAEGLREQLATVMRQQFAVSWESFVHQASHEWEHSATSKRRRVLATAMGKEDRPLSRDEILGLHPLLTSELFGRARKLSRDLNFLCAQGLVEPAEGGFRARTEQLRRLLPFRNRVE